MRPARSDAEAKVYAALAKGLPPGWTAWHSVRIRTRAGFLGEGDFVLAHPERGLLVLEVKGGRIEERDGRWTTNGVPLAEAPLDQARDFLSKLVRRLAEQGCRPPAYGAAACFPDTRVERQPSQDDLAGVVLGSDEVGWLREALPGLVERALPRPEAGAGRWMDAVHRLWGETWVPPLSLGARVRDLGERRFRLDEAQLLALDGLLGNARVLVHGPAGSGKTLLAAEAARRHAALGKRVLLLCFTRPLQKWLAARLAPDGVEVHTVSGLAHDLAARRPATRAEEGDAEYWKDQFLAACDACEPRWDVVVVDEAQDLQEEAWLLVTSLAEGKGLWAFQDEAQRFWPDRTPPLAEFHTTFRLGRGRRCPPGIDALAARCAGEPFDERAMRDALADGSLRLLACPSATSLADRLGEEVDRLLSDGLSPGDVGIVSLRGQQAEGTVFRLEKLGRHRIVPADAEGMEDRVVADSFLRWKGLERPAILVADLPEGDLSHRGLRMYVALTRALVAARVVAPMPRLAADPALRDLL
jgi:hypothetical protein